MDDITDLTLGEPVVVIGEDVNNVPFELQVTAVRQKSSARAMSAYGQRPKGKYVGLQVRYACMKGTCTYNPYDFTLRSKAGEEVDKAFGGFEPDLASGNLKQGRKALGWLTYDLQAGTYDLEYRSNIFSGDVANWVVKL